MPEHSSLGWINPVIQLVTSGGFGALVWYLIVRHLPAIEKDHREERDAWLRTHIEQQAKFEELLRECVHYIKNGVNDDRTGKKS